MLKTRNRKIKSVSEENKKACGVSAKKLPVGIAAVFLCAYFCLLGGCALGDPTGYTEETGEPVTGVTTAVATREPHFSTGETAEVGGVNVTMIALKESLGNEYWNPQIGFIYLICEFEIENNSDAEISISSILSFETFVDGKKKNLSLIAGVTHDVATADGTVEPGEMLHGSVGYEVPENWKEVEIAFSPDMMKKNSVQFRADKAQLVAK